MLIPVLLGVTLLVFTLAHFTPGDPVRAILGDLATPEAIEELTEELGLNDPFFVQYGNFVFNMLRGEFGISFATRRGVSDEIFARFPNTMRLAGMGVVVALILGIPLGIISAVKQYTPLDYAGSFVGLLGVSIPNFWLGLMLIMVFSVNLEWLPATGSTEWRHWVMPTFAIATGSAATIMRMTRSSMLESIRQDYIRTARAKGQKQSVVIFRHALRNALIPVATTTGLSFGSLLGGAILTETIFAIPGLGAYMVSSLINRDWPVVRGGVVLIATSFTVVNLLVDILYAFLDPRIRSQYR
jgi:peptide/nickel transport system permease protein